MELMVKHKMRKAKATGLDTTDNYGRNYISMCGVMELALFDVEAPPPSCFTPVAV